MSYSAYVLTEESRNKILSVISPMHRDVICHHVTYSFPDNAPPPKAYSVYVVGYSADKYVDAVVVEINGSIGRPDGKVYHITLSVNKFFGGKPAMSNNLLAKKDWHVFDEPFEIIVTEELLK